MLYTARKQMTLEGKEYAARAPIDISGLKPALRKRLLEQRRVVPLEAETQPEGVVPPKRKRGRPRKTPIAEATHGS